MQLVGYSLCIFLPSSYETKNINSSALLNLEFDKTEVNNYLQLKDLRAFTLLPVCLLMQTPAI